MPKPPYDQIIHEQINYYQARASEYDEWFLRQGRYDRGNALNQQWFAEVGQVRQALQQRNPSGHILEIACGTGLWTEQLLPFAERLTAVNAAADMITLNRQRLASDTIQLGAKSGLSRTHSLLCISDDPQHNKIAVIASNWGQYRNSA
ncbi:MAG: hypothetical protein GY943_33060 [Chloroflexi bacterium]|nr:hypothetical protein [Chloroflexota bacterium]